MSAGGATAGQAATVTTPREQTLRLAIPLAIIALPLIATFWPLLDRQHRFSAGAPDDWGHAYLVPFISAYAIWAMRDRFASMRPAPFWPGIIPLATGVAIYAFFLISNLSNHMFQGLGMVIAIFGLCLLILGPRMTLPLTFPIGYLLLGLTISEKVMIKVTFALQTFAAKGGNIALNVLGYPTEIRGNTLSVSTAAGESVPLNIAEACSGLRMVVAFVALGVAVAYFSCTQWWQRIMLVLLALPVALATNVVRVATLGVLSVEAPDFATGESHMLVGTLWLIPGLLAYLGLGWALRHIVAEPAKGGQKQGAAS
ncbi:MAG: exosortase/archaeosortase family protein [Phycisphaerales bacterium]